MTLDSMSAHVSLCVSLFPPGAVFFSCLMSANQRSCSRPLSPAGIDDCREAAGSHFKSLPMVLWQPTAAAVVESGENDL